MYRLLSFNESFGFHTEIFLVFEFLNFEIFLVSKCTFKKPDMKLKEGEKCRIASLLTSKRKCKQYFISKSSFFVLSCGSILYAPLSSAVLFAFTSSVSIHIYSPQGVSRNYFPYTTHNNCHIQRASAFLRGRLIEPRDNSSKAKSHTCRLKMWSKV